MMKPRLAAPRPAQAETLRIGEPMSRSSGQSHIPSMEAPDTPWARGYLDSGARKVRIVATRPMLTDLLDTLYSRLIRHREKIRIAPGLYALGEPDPASPILVTANYKPSFDAVRFSMNGHSAWLLALDTMGVNVWCAAGKGSFGNAELLRRARIARLDAVAPSAPLILPQLGAVGVSAWEIARRLRRRVLIGPLQARDLPAFIANGYTASGEQRRMSFGLGARAVLIPRELVSQAPLLAFAIVPALLLAWPREMEWTSFTLADYASAVMRWWLAPLGGLLSGLILFPLLIPLLPGKTFSVKGAILGFLAGTSWFAAFGHSPLADVLGILFSTALASWLAILFTGSSPYTSQGAVQRELKTALPFYGAAIALGALGLAAKLISLLLGGPL